MNRFVLGGLAALLMVGAGVFVAIGLAQDEPELPDAPPPPVVAEKEALPEADPADLVGPPPPVAPEARKASREERRFNRYDKDRNEVITRIELMSSRTKAFKKLDKDGNNLLTFEEWAVRTSDKFSGADADGNGQLTRSEFATTRPKRRKPACKC